MIRGNSKVYLDHAATTALKPEVLEQMKPYLLSDYGNPSSAYQLGERSNQAINRAREEIAQTIHAKPEEIYFTSGGSESDNWALKGTIDYAMFHNGDRNRMHVITSAIEHHAVLKTTSYLRKKGVEISMLYPDRLGVLSGNELLNIINKDTVMVSVMYANNEIGTIEPVNEFAEIAKRNGVLFHTDAVQAFGQIPIDVKKEQIDLLSASGHKIGGPKGIGFLYIKNGKQMEPFIHGGGQENGMRAGTENVAAIVGLGAAASIMYRNCERRTRKLLEMRNYLAQYILSALPESYLNGAQCDNVKEWEKKKKLDRLPGNLNISVRGVSGAEVVARLDKMGISASTASACSKHSHATSHVLRAIGLSDELASSTIRFTIGEENTMSQMRYAAGQIVRIVREIRKY